MDLLILGGSVFLGRHIVEAALARGHTITLFNRGQHNPGLFPEVEKVRGDRDGGLAPLAGRRWDAAIDTCGYLPRVVRQSAELLAGSAGHYTFISSISVYADPSVPGIDEGSPVGTLSDPSVETITGETYGPLKALCEQVVEAAMPGRALQIRPGLIVGPHDPLDRFTYWVMRVARGGRVLAPGQADSPVQIIDVRDLARWVVSMVEAGRTGVYNATGPEEVLTFGTMLEAIRRTSGSDARFVWVSEQFLLDAGVQPWSDMPLWLPASMPEARGLMAVDVRKALAAGLQFRPLEATIADTLAWAGQRPAGHEWRAGISAEREQALLEAWGSRSGE